MSTLRAELFDAVRLGLMIPEEAEAEAARQGLPPLCPAPDPNRFDPIRETHWSLQMTIAWVAFRSVHAVRAQWDAYRAEQFYWSSTGWQDGPEGYAHEGWLVERVGPATYSLMVTSDSWEVGTDDVPASESEFAMSPGAARETLWDALKRGEIEASAIKQGDAERAFISAETWCDLSIEEHGGRDYLVVSIGLGRRGAVYERVMFRSEDVLTVWPSVNTLAPDRTGAPGRPSSIHLIEPEFKARLARGETLKTLRLESQALADWFSAAHPLAARPTPKTIENRIRASYRAGKTPK